MTPDTCCLAALALIAIVGVLEFYRTQRIEAERKAMRHAYRVTPPNDPGTD